MKKSGHKRVQNREEDWMRNGKKTRIHPKVSWEEDHASRIEQEDEEENQHQGIPTTPCVKNARVTFVLENASLKLGVIRKTTKLLNAEEHSKYLLKEKKNLDDFRPDILHRALLTIIDSPLRKSGMVQAIYVKIENGLLFEVKPHTRIPRTFKRFYGLMLQLLQRKSITSNDKHEKLIRVVEQPVTRHLPTNSRIIGVSPGSEKFVKLEDYVAAISDDVNLVFVVGLMSHREVEKTYLDDFISVSRCPLSASGIIGGRVCDALEEIWDII